MSDKEVSTKADRVYYGSCLCVGASEVEMLGLEFGTVIKEGRVVRDANLENGKSHAAGYLVLRL